MISLEADSDIQKSVILLLLLCGLYRRGLYRRGVKISEPLSIILACSSDVLGMLLILGV